jgi:DNA-binding CsgD family transcriptional regulator
MVFAIDRAGRASLLVGARAEMLGRDLLLVNGRIVAPYPPDRPALDAAVARAIGSPGRSGVVALSSLDARRRLIVRTVPVTGVARDAFGAAAALAIVRVWPRPAGSRGETVAALREAFGLTATEAEVAALVAMGLPPKLAALLLVIDEGTARNHLKAAMSKAGVHRQAELAGLTGSLRP